MFHVSALIYINTWNTIEIWIIVKLTNLAFESSIGGVLVSCE